MLLFEIRRIHHDSKASYGSPRITKELKANGFDVSRPRVARVMRKHGIRAVHAKKFMVTTDSKHNNAIVENKLNRNFRATHIAETWVSDIIYVRTRKGWIYLTVILDLLDRKVVGWFISEDMTAKNTTINVWEMAVTNRPPIEKLLFHSDRGIQYACKEFTKSLDSYSTVERSMRRKGNCWDNTVAERFFKSINVEHMYRQRVTSKKTGHIVHYCSFLNG